MDRGVPFPRRWLLPPRFNVKYEGSLCPLSWTVMERPASADPIKFRTGWEKKNTPVRAAAATTSPPCTARVFYIPGDGGAKGVSPFHSSMTRPTSNHSPVFIQGRSLAIRRMQATGLRESHFRLSTPAIHS
ncbi:hypothetical protein MRX96_004747 [Rhipicephalus microplus]